ncbi:MAG TPA: metallophosphoesterase family protein [Candidatus Hydrogenedentes bacterium]|nr:metallophosphoesterase family protein [Candidatus Hydrogenedentota bacterium]HPG66710.1 metallophosphoesterase family protein [Candidatus Hydrogenedentota bacterium]
MRYAIVSDIHSNLEAFETVLKAIENVGVDQIICLGDVVGYNGNPNECVAIIRERSIPTICGNHDAVASGIEEPWGFNPIALAAALWTREALEPDNLEWLKALPDGRRFPDFLAAHGAPGDRDTYLFSWEDIIPHVPLVEDQDASLCFFGHTHCPGIFSTDGVYSIDDDGRFVLGNGKTFFINPGSVGQPRDGDPRAAFGLFDTESSTFQQIRTSYPVQEAASCVTKVGLPTFLAERLLVGR